jgi:hypothetical protein
VANSQAERSLETCSVKQPSLEGAWSNIHQAMERAPCAVARVSKMIRSIDRWKGLSPEAIAAGSQAQVFFFVQDAQRGILMLYEILQKLHETASRNPVCIGCGSIVKHADECIMVEAKKMLGEGSYGNRS